MVGQEGALQRLIFPRFFAMLSLVSQVVGNTQTREMFYQLFKIFEYYVRPQKTRLVTRYEVCRTEKDIAEPKKKVAEPK